MKWQRVDKAPEADVCLILEGSYPYVSGGVSSWTHDLIKAQSHLGFHLLILLAPGSERKPKYELPGNVVGTTEVVLQRPPRGRRRLAQAERLMRRIEPVLSSLTYDGGLRDLRFLLRMLAQGGSNIGSRVLLDSEAAWAMLLRMYQRDYKKSSFLDYFWSWRGLMGGLYTVLLGEMPRARVYHAVSTGYAGLYLARARVETGRPALVTEHGIYTNERRIEIAMADWLHEDEGAMQSMVVDKTRRDLRDMWMHSFQSYSRACYEACDRIITLFEGNQSFQLHDGAPPERLEVIPNGIDYERYAAIKRHPVEGEFCIALIGRVVPIKDVKTYIRAIAQVQEIIPQARGYLLGPYDEDPEYYEECRVLVEHLGLQGSFEFTGKVDLMEWLGRIDLIVLTSISEGQPLVILEAGAAGIPCVATDVGACREMIEGDGREAPSLGSGGAVVPLSNPSSVARAIIRLLSEPSMLEMCGQVMRERVRLYYNKDDLTRTYQKIYETYREKPGKSHSEEEVA